MQAPMISVPLKATNEIDWIQPLRMYIRQTYGDNPERYAEECATLNRLRQDMRGAGKDSASGRDLLYRYYGQLELLDLRFPVDENHIKISFTWFDAFTHKPTSQYSLAFEKASIIFNISAVLSCHAAHQSRAEDSGLKAAYQSFQASAGMFTYINDNFLHAPSIDLSRDTVKILIQIMLAQAQEVFLEKQIVDGKKVGLLAKLASQAAYLYGQVIEGVQEHVNRAIFEKVWLLVVQIKLNYLNSLSQYFQALADDDSNAHGTAVSRLQVAEIAAKEAIKCASAFPGTVPTISNLASDCGIIFLENSKRNLANIQEKLSELMKDNDYIYHQTVPSEAGLAIIPKLPAAKAIPVSELYAGQDIQRITGPDIFQKIVPLSVTESASLYDEEKAKLLRAETERVEMANSEIAASLDYLHLPNVLQIIKGNSYKELTADDQFKDWCLDVANSDLPPTAFDKLKSSKEFVVSLLDKSSQQLDLEESVCEKMRSKYEANWTQQPSSRLTTTLREDIRNYRDALNEASDSDSQLYAKYHQHQADFAEMKLAGQIGETDVLFQKALIHVKKDAHNPREAEGNLLDEDFENNGASVMDQVARIEETLAKLNLIKRERGQVLKDLKEKIHNDDISQVLILNKKSISNYEAELFQAELEKFRPHQSRLLSANHKQASLMKELTSALNTLLQDKRVKAEQSKHDAVNRQRTSVLLKYKRIYEDFLNIKAGLLSAKEWYHEMKDTISSLEKNVEAFVNNRRSEGAQLLRKIEQDRKNSISGQPDMELGRIRDLIEKMSMGSKASSGASPQTNPLSTSYPRTVPPGHYPTSNPQPQLSAQSQSAHSTNNNNQDTSSSTVMEQSWPQDVHGSMKYTSQQQINYNPGVYPSWSPPTQNRPPQNLPNYGRPTHTPIQQQFLPQGFLPPPPPPGPPPLMPQQNLPQSGSSITGSQHSESNQAPKDLEDQWSGLNSWR